MRNKAVVWIILVLVVIGLAFVLNPSPERHREKIKEAVAARNQLAGVLGIGHLTAFLSSYHSLGVASYTVVNDKTVTVGAFGLIAFVGQDEKKQ